MYNIDGTEIYLKYHSEDLLQQAEHERQMRQVQRILTDKEPESPNKRLVHMEVTLVQTRHNTFCEIAIKGD
jgi:hypothetical protein